LKVTDRYIARSGQTGRVIVARVKPGSDLLRSLKKVAAEEGVTSGIILSGVGLLKQARLRNCKSLPKKYPINDANRTFLSFEKPLEILSISGNVTLAERELVVHAHLTLSSVEGEEITVIGGHLIEGCVVFGFSEFVIMELEGIEMTKRFDEETQSLQLFA
jgi:predicted DNA-binding protein with PD1-like motif